MMVAPVTCPRTDCYVTFYHRHDDSTGHVIQLCSSGVDHCNRADLHVHEMMPKVEAVNHPNHYGGDTTYETIKVIAAWQLGFLLGNAVKYLSRAGKKDPSKLVEDLKKGRWYLDQAITRLERGEGLF